MSSGFLLLALAFVVFIVLAALKSKQGAAGSVGLHYMPAKTLFSAAERSFLGILDQAVGPEHRVFGKVRVADVAAVKPGLGNAARQGALNRIAYKHFDFLVCRASDLAIVCVVELNDKSHSSRRAQSRDDLLVKVCKTINLPLLMVPAKQAYSPQDIRSQFLAAVTPPQAGASVGT
ncbi:DUF2726 domain-containing protein [Luteimonas sp. MC1572]|uniref:DUF2726 domain-containing protein n=1 Tax=Luteimonas sp. MC1572 TaxID=2799325 RepID=UPI0018F0E4E3|nr:DUF2726 domain-containing protein [Luteimonas sp. MC1572]MBJ6983030.1 DUF2726 domain-containing protein [Luteimonas sp. MC1572]QQO03236.1 DUF2726 domain-containing protein [Luteimonas sp. MC1572]